MALLDHMSATQLGMYLRCGKQYEFRYVQEKRCPPGVAQTIGTGAHKAREAALRHKLTTRGQDLPMDATLDAARDAVASGFAGEIVLDGDYADLTTKAARDRAIDEAVDFARVDRAEIIPQISPIGVELKVEAEVPALGTTLLGYIDVLAEEPAAAHPDGRVPMMQVVRDLKTTRKTPPADAVDTSESLTMYSLLRRLQSGRMPDAVRLDVTVRLSKGVKAVLFKSHRDGQDLQILLNRLGAAMSAIRAGVFLPCSGDAWQCDPRWCGYWSECPYVRREGRQRKEA